MVSGTAVPTHLVLSSLLSLRKGLKGRLSFYILGMEVDRKAGKREIYVSCQVLTKPHWITSLSRCQAAAQTLKNFLSLTLFNLNRGLVIHVLKSPAKQGGQKYLPKSFVLTRIFSVLPMGEAQWDYISFCATEDKRKLLRAFFNVRRDLAFSTQRKILVELSCAGRQTQREKTLLSTLKGSKYSLTINT